jgi:hypothetical protein
VALTSVLAEVHSRRGEGGCHRSFHSTPRLTIAHPFHHAVDGVQERIERPHQIVVAAANQEASRVERLMKSTRRGKEARERLAVDVTSRSLGNSSFTSDTVFPPRV